MIVIGFGPRDGQVDRCAGLELAPARLRRASITCPWHGVAVPVWSTLPTRQAGASSGGRRRPARQPDDGRHRVPLRALGHDGVDLAARPDLGARPGIGGDHQPGARLAVALVELEPRPAGGHLLRLGLAEHRQRRGGGEPASVRYQPARAAAAVEQQHEQQGQPAPPALAAPALTLGGLLGRTCARSAAGWRVGHRSAASASRRTRSWRRPWLDGRLAPAVSGAGSVARHRAGCARSRHGLRPLGARGGRPVGGPHRAEVLGQLGVVGRPSRSAARTRRTWVSSTLASCGRRSGSRAVARATSASRYGGIGPAVRNSRRRRHVLVDVGVRHLDRGVAGVRLAPGEQLEQHDAGAVDVGAGVGAARTSPARAAGRRRCRSAGPGSRSRSAT